MRENHSFKMRRLALAAALTLGMAGANGVWAQQKAAPTAKQLQGHWMLVDLVTERDGKKEQTFGANPKGLFIFDPSGRYSIQLARSDLPKFASNNRMTGTPEENKAVVQGLLSHFGTYQVKDGAFTITPTASSFPNWTGTEQPARKFEIKGDNLTIINPSPSAGGGITYLYLKRAK